MWKYLSFLNVFVYCKFLKLLGHIMVLLVLGIVGFTWYAVVPATYGPMMVTGSPGSRFGSSVLVLFFSWLVSVLQSATWFECSILQQLCVELQPCMHQHAPAPLLPVTELREL
jgi:hypothetical protein